MLGTERLVLRPVTADDQGVLLAHWTQPDVRRFLFDGAALSAAEVTETIGESVHDFAVSGFGIWLIELRSGPGLVGTAGLRPLEDSGLEIFYSLAPGAWGHGYATEAARAVVEHGLGPLGLPEAARDDLLAVRAATAGRRGPGQPGSARVFPGESASRAAAFGPGMALDVLPGGPGLAPGGLRAAIARAVIKAAPDKARERRETTARFARVERWAEDSGNAALMGRELPPMRCWPRISGSAGGPVSCARPAWTAARTSCAPAPTWTCC